MGHPIRYIIIHLFKFITMPIYHKHNGLLKPVNPPIQVGGGIIHDTKEVHHRELQLKRIWRDDPLSSGYLEINETVTINSSFEWDPGGGGDDIYEKQTKYFTFSSGSIINMTFNYFYEYSGYPGNDTETEYTTFDLIYKTPVNPNITSNCRCEIYDIFSNTIIIYLNSNNYNPSTQRLTLNFHKNGRFYYEDTDFDKTQAYNTQGSTTKLVKIKIYL